MLLPAFLLASLLAGPGPVGPTVKYKFESKNTTTVDLSAMGQPSQNVETSSVAWLAVTMSDTTGGQIAHVVIDSLHFDAGPMAGMLPDSMLQFKPGTYFHLFIVNGKIQGNAVPSSMTLATMQAAPAVAMLFPGVDGGRAVGSTWADTVTKDSTVSGTTIGVKTYTTWTVSAKEGDTFTLDATSTGTMTMNVMGNDAQAKTTGKQHLVVPAHGTTRLGSSETRLEMAMVMGSNTAQMSVIATFTLAQLP